MQSVEPNLRWLSVFQQSSGSLISFLASSRFWSPEVALTVLTSHANIPVDAIDEAMRLNLDDFVP